MVLSSQKDNIVKFNQCLKSHKRACIIYADLVSLIKKLDGCANNEKIHQQQKLVNIFLADTRCQIYGYLII